MLFNQPLTYPLSNKLKAILLLAIVFVTAVGIGAIASRAILFAVAAFTIVVLGLTVLVWPDAVTLVVIFLIYTNTAVIAVKYHHVPFILGASVPMILVFPLVYNLVIRKQKIIINSIFPLLLFFLVIQALGTLFSEDTLVSWDTLVTFVSEGLILYFLVFNVVRTPTILRQVTWVLLIAGMFIGGISLLQQITKTFHNNYWGFAQVADTGFGTGIMTLQGEVQQPRLAGPLGEKNYFAQMMLMLFPLGLFRFWGERSKLLKLLAAFATSLITLGAALSFSRGAAVAFVVLIVVMVILRYIKFYQFALVVVGLALLMTAVPQFGARLDSLQALAGLFNEDSAGVAGTDTSIQGRLGEMFAAGLVFVDHPLIGVGPGMFKYYYPKYAELVGLRLHTGTREAHNLFLDIAADTGGLGLLSFLAILGVTLWSLDQARRRWRTQKPELANLSSGFLLAVVSYMATGIFLSMAYSRYFWLIMALGGAASYVSGTDLLAKSELREDFVNDSS
jgi:putative inorganic carbon (HCO3(-)) transporter